MKRELLKRRLAMVAYFLLIQLAFMPLLAEAMQFRWRLWWMPFGPLPSIPIPMPWPKE